MAIIVIPNVPAIGHNSHFWKILRDLSLMAVIFISTKKNTIDYYINFCAGEQRLTHLLKNRCYSQFLFFVHIYIIVIIRVIF